MLVLITILFSALNISSPTTTSATTTLEVNVTNLEAVKGYVYISLYNEPKKFPKEGGHYKKIKVKVKKSTVTYTFKNLPKGEYGIATYHDKNSDGECNLNFIGIPTEGYGFSKNFRPKLSAPSFSDVKFTLKNKYTSTIKLIN